MRNELYKLLHELILELFERCPGESVSAMDIFEVAMQVLTNMNHDGEAHAIEER